MRRRRFLKAAPAFGLAALAGCSSGDTDRVTEVDSPTQRLATDTVTAPATSESSGDGTPTSPPALDLPWTQLPGPPGGPVTDIAPSPADPDYLYATTWTAGLYASSDGGASWIQGPPGEHHKRGIEASPHDPQEARWTEVRTVDGGATWFGKIHEPHRLRNPGTEITAFIEFDPLDEDILYAGTTEGFSRSFDAGQTWEPVTIGVDTVSDTECRVAATPAREGVVYAAFNQDGTLVRSDDRGDSWQVVIGPDDAPTPRGPIVVEQSGTAGYVTVGRHGVYRFGDGPTQRVTPPFLFHNTITLSADDERLYFIARPPESEAMWADMALYEFDATSGETRVVPRPEKPASVSAHPTDPSVLYFGGWSWVWETRDRGETWTKLSNGFIDQYLAAVGVNPSHPGTVMPGSVCSTGLNVSHDHGETYTWKRSGLAPYHEGQFGEHYVMQIEARGDRVYATTGAGLLISLDNGDSWRLLENEFSGHGEREDAHGGHDHGTSHLHGLGIDPADPRVVYVGAGLSGGIGGEDDYWGGSSFIWKSEDGGGSWRAITDGYPTDVDTSIQDILVSSHDPAVVYAGTNAAVNVEHPAHDGIGVFRSTDAGERWEQLGTPFSNVFFVEEDPGDDRVLYVSTADGVFRTRDGGATWANVFPHRTRALLSHPEADGVVFAGTQRYDGYWDLFVTEDGGDSWAEGNLTIKMSRGPGSRDYDGINRAGRYGEKGHIMDLAVDASTSHLVAATRGAGLWRGDVSRLFE